MQLSQVVENRNFFRSPAGLVISLKAFVIIPRLILIIEAADSILSYVLARGGPGNSLIHTSHSLGQSGALTIQQDRIVR